MQHQHSILFFKASHRTLPEQGVGLFIYLIVSFGLEIFDRWFGTLTVSLSQIPWALPTWPQSPLWAFYHILLPFSMWLLWRKASLHTLKLELVCFLSPLLLEAASFTSLLALQLPLLSLIFFLLLFCNLLLFLLLVRKKDRLAGLVLFPPLGWLAYMITVNMALCTGAPN